MDTPLSDQELGEMVRKILRETPDFQVFKLQHDPRYIEVSSVYVVDLTVEQMENIRTALRQIAALQTVIKKEPA